MMIQKLGKIYDPFMNIYLGLSQNVFGTVLGYIWDSFDAHSEKFEDGLTATS